MKMTIRAINCEKDDVAPLLPPTAPWRGHFSETKLNPEILPIGSILGTEDAPSFHVVGFDWLALPSPAGCSSLFVPLIRALRDIREGASIYHSRKAGWSLAIITLSDKGSRGEREDLAGPLAAKLVSEVLPVSIIRFFLLPDDKDSLKALLARLALSEKYDLILTCGGTGLSERDVAPETTLSLLDKILPGFSIAMTETSLKITPRGMISRAVAGIIGRALVINLPGSAKATEENLAAILPALDHALAKLNGDQADCGA